MSAMSSSEGRGQPMILCADFMTLCRAFFYQLLNSLNTTLRDSEKMHSVTQWWKIIANFTHGLFFF